jgi:hypothetical protein
VNFSEAEWGVARQAAAGLLWSKQFYQYVVADWVAGDRRDRDRDFLESVFQKLLLNFTWWVNRKDADGENLFSGGFVGLDNIGVLDRSQVLPNGVTLRQADGTAWMAFYCITMDPCIFNTDGVEHRVDYDPGESSTHLFGGNSN